VLVRDITGMMKTILGPPAIAPVIAMMLVADMMLVVDTGLAARREHRRDQQMVPTRLAGLVRRCSPTCSRSLKPS